VAWLVLTQHDDGVLFAAGRYDWSGELELAPDPFIEWQDAASLLHTNSSSNSSSSSSSNTTDGKRRRSLLQDSNDVSSNSTSTGMIPVQGRVGIRESKAPVDPGASSNPGSVALDDTGDIVLICANGVCPASLTGIPGQAETPDPTQPGDSAQTPISAASGSRLVVILLAALVAPAGLAICATGVAAAILRKRRKQKEDEQARDAKHKRSNNSLTAQEQELGLQGRTGVKQSWRSVDGASWVPGAALSRAVLRRSDAGGSAELTDAADLALQQGAIATSVERLQPGETGFGSVCGAVRGGAAMVTLPPARDSIDGGGVLERSRGGRWSLAGSVAGMASSISHALHLR
jgi:hypothetical protein